ncbi:MAG: C40 family peptidase [Desulfatiglandales bacterium]
MKPYFENDPAWVRFLEILQSWKGTPYRHLQMVKGRGADCSLFVAACFREAGILTEVRYDYYPRDWHYHTHEEYVTDGFLKHLREHLLPGLAIREEDPKTPLFRGDFIGFSSVKSGVTNHAGLYIGGGRMIHSINHRGVIESFMGSFWREKMTTIVRVLV